MNTEFESIEELKRALDSESFLVVEEKKLAELALTNSVFFSILNTADNFSFGKEEDLCQLGESIRDVEMICLHFLNININSFVYIFQNGAYMLHKNEIGIQKRGAHVKKDIFFLRAESGFIRISGSWSVTDRTSQIMNGTHEGVTLIKQFSGTLRDKQDIKERFSHLHEKGDWYRPAPELLEYIDNL